MLRRVALFPPPDVPVFQSETQEFAIAPPSYFPIFAVGVGRTLYYSYIVETFIHDPTQQKPSSVQTRVFYAYQPGSSPRKIRTVNQPDGWSSVVVAAPSRGGFFMKGEKALWFFDSKSEEWSRVADLPPDTLLVCMAFDPVSEEVVMGGSQGLWRLTQGVWKKVQAPVPTVVDVAFIGNRMYVAGPGGSGCLRPSPNFPTEGCETINPSPRTVYEFVPEIEGWRPVGTLPDYTRILHFLEQEGMMETPMIHHAWVSEDLRAVGNTLILIRYLSLPNNIDIFGPDKSATFFWIWQPPTEDMEKEKK